MKGQFSSKNWRKQKDKNQEAKKQMEIKYQKLQKNVSEKSENWEQEANKLQFRFVV